VPTAQQFICKKCRSLVTIEMFQQSDDGTPYCRCPKILPVTRLLD
jgi:hypothetical protein